MFRDHERCGGSGRIEVAESMYAMGTTFVPCDGHEGCGGDGQVYECWELGCDGTRWPGPLFCEHAKDDNDSASDEPSEPDYSPSYDDQARDRLANCDGYDRNDPKGMRP